MIFRQNSAPFTPANILLSHSEIIVTTRKSQDNFEINIEISLRFIVLKQYATFLSDAKADSKDQGRPQGRPQRILQGRLQGRLQRRLQGRLQGRLQRRLQGRLQGRVQGKLQDRAHTI